MDKTCETCKHFLRETKKRGRCAVKPYALGKCGKPHKGNDGKPLLFFVYRSHKACLKYEEKEVQDE